MKINKFKIEDVKENSLFICAGGFEERALGSINKLSKKDKIFFNYSCICAYNVHQTENINNVTKIIDKLTTITKTKPNKIVIKLDNIYNTLHNIRSYFKKNLLENLDNIYIDISGMSNFLTLILLSECYDIFNNKNIHIIYSEAKEYYPTREETSKIIDTLTHPNQLTYLELERFTSTGARDFFPLPKFRGNFDAKQIATIIFLGYEPIRISSFLNQYRPKTVIALYGKSPHKKFNFRTNFSKRIHTELLDDYMHYNDEVSTFDIDEIYEKLQIIYRNFFKDYNISIFPQNSKLQTVACFLFVKKYPDVQIAYCLPGKFNPKHYSEGVGNIYLFTLTLSH